MSYSEVPPITICSLCPGPLEAFWLVCGRPVTYKKSGSTESWDRLSEVGDKSMQ